MLSEIKPGLGKPYNKFCQANTSKSLITLYEIHYYATEDSKNDILLKGAPLHDSESDNIKKKSMVLQNLVAKYATGTGQVAHIGSISKMR